jgi:hypothetical protein
MERGHLHGPFSISAASSDFFEGVPPLIGSPVQQQRATVPAVAALGLQKI